MLPIETVLHKSHFLHEYVSIEIPNALAFRVHLHLKLESAGNNRLFPNDGTFFGILYLNYNKSITGNTCFYSRLEPARHDSYVFFSLLVKQQ